MTLTEGSFDKLVNVVFQHGLGFHACGSVFLEHYSRNFIPVSHLSCTQSKEGGAGRHGDCAGDPHPREAM